MLNNSKLEVHHGDAAGQVWGRGRIGSVLTWTVGESVAYYDYSFWLASLGNSLPRHASPGSLLHIHMVLALCVYPSLSVFKVSF